MLFHNSGRYCRPRFSGATRGDTKENKGWRRCVLLSFCDAPKVEDAPCPKFWSRNMYDRSATVLFFRTLCTYPFHKRFAVQRYRIFPLSRKQTILYVWFSIFCAGFDCCLSSPHFHKPACIDVPTVDWLFTDAAFEDYRNDFRQAMEAMGAMAAMAAAMTFDPGSEFFLSSVEDKSNLNPPALDDAGAPSLLPFSESLPQLSSQVFILPPASSSSQVSPPSSSSQLSAPQWQPTPDQQHVACALHSKLSGQKSRVKVYLFHTEFCTRKIRLFGQYVQKPRTSMLPAAANSAAAKLLSFDDEEVLLELTREFFNVSLTGFGSTDMVCPFCYGNVDG